MVRRENIISKVEKGTVYLNRLETYRSLNFKEIRQNPEKLAAIERILYLASQTVIDLAEMLVKDKKLGKPETMSQSFDVLFDSMYIDENLKNSMIKMVGFRNILSHGYEYIDYTILEDVLKIHLKELKTFIDIVRTKENIG